MSWHDNGAEVEYAPAKTFFFREDLSVGPEDMKLTVLNIPMIVSFIDLRLPRWLPRYSLTFLATLSQTFLVTLSQTFLATLSQTFLGTLSQTFLGTLSQSLLGTLS